MKTDGRVLTRYLRCTVKMIASNSRCTPRRERRTAVHGNDRNGIKLSLAVAGTDRFAASFTVRFYTYISSYVAMNTFIRQKTDRTTKNKYGSERDVTVVVTDAHIRSLC